MFVCSFRAGIMIDQLFGCIVVARRVASGAECRVHVNSQTPQRVRCCTGLRRHGCNETRTWQSERKYEILPSLASLSEWTK